MKGQEKRQVSERSLENLKLGAESRKLGKVRHNFTILPESMDWLRETGNASNAIDTLVEAARNGGLDSNHTHERIEQEHQESISVYEGKIQELELALQETYQELASTRSLLETSRKLERGAVDSLVTCHQDGFRAAEILKQVIGINLRSAAWRKAQGQIQEALELIDDV